MNYLEQMAFSGLECSYLGEPDEDEEREDDADFEYECMREDA